MRAQLRSASLVTGKLYVALDFFPRSPKAQVKWASAPAELPTTPSGLAELQQTIASLATKLDKFPLAELGTDARSAIGSADKLLKRVDTDITPELKVALKNGAALMARLDSEVTGEAKAMLVDARKAFVTADKLLAAESPLQSDTREAMRELARAAHSIRMLADYLERNPQSVIMGKKEGGE
jgi:paraquat-inducible protein B